MGKSCSRSDDLCLVLDVEINVITNRLDEGEQLSYITEDDIKTNKVRVLSPEEIELEDALSLGPDCDDLRVLRKRPSSPISTKDLTDRGPLSTTNYVVGKKIKPFRVSLNAVL